MWPGERGISDHATSISNWRSRCRPSAIEHPPPLSGADRIKPSRFRQRAVTGLEPFLTGFLEEGANRFHGRPVDVLQLRDGSLLVSDEQNGAIYRVSHQR